MTPHDNIVIPGKHKKPIVLDITYSNTVNQPVIIFCHGYKGFKDWGAWHLMGKAFTDAGFCFLKFNFSHNGGTVKTPIDFPDLEAFGNNNYSKELDDLESVIDWLFEKERSNPAINLNNITLIGHSRGGGIVAIKAEEDPRVKQIVSLASISNFGKRSSTIGDLENWKKTGVKYVLNGRTKQKMPHYFQFYQDYMANKERLDIKRAVSHLKIPHLVIHGDQDSSISIEEAKAIHNWNPKSHLEVIAEADHVFNVRHPWDKEIMSNQLTEVTTKIIVFLKSNLEQV